ITFTADAVDDNGLDFDFTWTFQSFPGANAPTPNLLENFGTNSNISYSIAEEGSYTLNVRADNRDGNINTAETDIVIFTVTNTQQIFVHPGQGNDALTVDQVSLTSPLNSIQKAIEYVGASDEIIILPNLQQDIPQVSTYDITSTLNLNKSGNLDQKISIIALENNLIRLKAQGTDTAFLITNQSHIKFKFIEFNGFNAGAIRLVGSSNIDVDNCKFTNNKVGVKLDQTTNTTISSSFFKENEQAIYLLDSDSNNILLSTFSKNTKNGVFFDFQALQSSENNLVSFSTFYDNGTEYDGSSIFDSGLSFGNNPNNSFTNCLFLNNIKDYHSLVSNNSQNNIDKHVSFANVGIEKDPDILALPVASWLVADPFISDPDNDDFAPLFHPNSPIIEKGTSGLNIGAFQGSSKSYPSTRVIY
ncbi:right-handed parallel beta-helix repeat-containing protein, partial [bacterium]|nr:right-handed parallel beta-helix repeat-containing protein [bacterium]